MNSRGPGAARPPPDRLTDYEDNEERAARGPALGREGKLEQKQVVDGAPPDFCTFSACMSPPLG